VRIRQIEDQDRDPVVRLLTGGFTRRTEDYWRAAFDKLKRQIAPPNQPQFGYLLEEASEIIGVILIIWAPAGMGADGGLRANLSSWFVKEQFRSFAAMLLARACRGANVTYLNVSAAEHTVAICEAMGFRKYTNGQSLSVPMFAKQLKVGDLYRFGAGHGPLQSMDTHIMTVHIEMGCVGYVGEWNGQRIPFLFVKRMIKGLIPAWQMIYGPNANKIKDFGRALGLEMMRSGAFFLILDGDGSPLGMPAKFYEGRVPKYYKGVEPPQVNDLTFTEIALFGM
jgi:hypothetical protein